MVFNPQDIMIDGGTEPPCRIKGSKTDQTEVDFYNILQGEESLYFTVNLLELGYYLTCYHACYNAIII